LLLALATAAPAAARAADPPTAAEPARDRADDEPSRPPAEGDARPGGSAPGGAGRASPAARDAPPRATGSPRPSPADAPPAVDPERGVPADPEGDGEAERRARFGRRGRFVIDEIIGLRSLVGASGLGAGGGGWVEPLGLFTMGTASSSGGDAEGRSSTVTMRPSVDVFVTDDLSIGVGASTWYSHFHRSEAGGGAATRYRGYGFSVEPRVGTVLRLVDSLALWPRVGVGYQRAWADGNVEGPRAYTLSAFARAGLVTTLGRHAFLDAGPEVRLRLGRNDAASGPADKTTTAGVGVSAALGLSF
jgi:hypothetical protein